MRFIAAVQGSVALKYSADETSPESGLLTRDLVEFVAKEYKFSIKPQVPPGSLYNPVLIFQTGETTIEEKVIPINQFTLIIGGTIVTAKTTDLAESIAGQFINKIDADLGYKIAANIRERYYQSNIIAEFSPGLEKQIAGLGRAQEILQKEIKRPDMPFNLKRLAFGGGEGYPNPPGPFSIDDIPKSDFTIERRAGEPSSLNRYFCSAPLQTAELVRVLGMVEDAMRG